MDDDTGDIDKQNSFLFELKDFSIESIKIIILSLIVIAGIRMFIMQPFFVSGKSMEPNFHDGDYLIVDEISYRIGDPKRGDVVIFRYPNDPSEYYIKRIVGLPGEKIGINENEIKIYNVENPEGFKLGEELYIPESTITTGTYTRELKNDEYYVLGDNRIASADSRVWGVLEKHFIVGRAWIRAWPFDNLSVFKDISY
ncbi:MAG: signal peptidase I [Candidatus Pacebacteria bacterium]|nr:signal peptidase I [Candidatus Paceibacterota bacterium]